MLFSIPYPCLEYKFNPFTFIFQIVKRLCCSNSAHCFTWPWRWLTPWSSYSCYRWLCSLTWQLHSQPDIQTILLVVQLVGSLTSKLKRLLLITLLGLLNRPLILVTLWVSSFFDIFEHPFGLLLFLD